MAIDFLKTLNVQQPNRVANFSLAFDYKFTRANPTDALVAKNRVEKVMNYSLAHDCQTGKQL